MTWRTILTVGAVASAAAVGCTVTATTGNGDAGIDSGSGATSAGGKAGSGGSGGSSGAGGTKVTGGTGGTGATAGASGSKTDAAPDGPIFVRCNPDPMKTCDSCVQTKCCQEWLDCANDADCLKSVGSKDGEFTCIQDCLIGDGGTIMTVDDCAGMCQHDATVSTATSELIACMRNMGDSGTNQNCTTQCFGRDLPP